LLALGLAGVADSEARPPPRAEAAAAARQAPVQAAARQAPVQAAARKAQRRAISRRWKRVQAGGERARQWFAKTRAGKAAVRVGKKLGWQSKKLRARLTWLADGLERSLPPRMSRGLHMLRSVNPFATGAYAFHKVEQDPAFMIGYGVLSSTLGKLQTPTMLALGASVPATTITSILLGPPLDFTVLTLREHHRRTDRSRSYWGTVKAVGREYKQFVSDRRAQNRAFGAKLGLKPLGGRAPASPQPAR
jgi:hypothetical protein